MPTHYNSMIRIDGTVRALFLHNAISHLGSLLVARDRYESQVRGILQSIESTKSGQALIAAIDKPIWIIPMKNPWERQSISNPLGHGRSIIEFTPDTWILGSPVLKYVTYDTRGIKDFTPGGDRADEVLFHELVHSMRIGHGVTRDRSMGDGFENEEEFCAVLLANIYISEIGREPRLSHTGFASLPKYNQVFTVFYDRYTKQIARCINSMPRLARSFAAVDCPFNPIYEYILYNIPFLIGPAIYRHRKPHLITRMGIDESMW